MIVDEATMLSLSRKLGERDAEFTWAFPVEGRGLTVPEAQTLVAHMQTIGQKIGARAPGVSFGGYSSPLGGPGRTTSQLNFIGATILFPSIRAGPCVPCTRGPSNGSKLSRVLYRCPGYRSPDARA